MNTYPLNTTVRLSILVTDDNTGAVTDPGALKLYVLGPDGTEQTYDLASGQLQRDGVGQFHFDILAGLPGRWVYGFLGTDIGPSNQEQSTGDVAFWVTPSSVFGRTLTGSAPISGGANLVS